MDKQVEQQGIKTRPNYFESATRLATMVYHANEIGATLRGHRTNPRPADEELTQLAQEFEQAVLGVVNADNDASSVSQTNTDCHTYTNQLRDEISRLRGKLKDAQEEVQNLLRIGDMKETELAGLKKQIELRDVVVRHLGGGPIYTRIPDPSQPTEMAQAEQIEELVRQLEGKDQHIAELHKGIEELRDLQASFTKGWGDMVIDLAGTFNDKQLEDYQKLREVRDKLIDWVETRYPWLTPYLKK